MVARIYGWSKPSGSWAFVDTFEHLAPTKNLLKAWLQTDVGRAQAREYPIGRWLVVPDSTNHWAGEYTAKWVTPPAPAPELQVTRVVSH